MKGEKVQYAKSGKTEEEKSPCRDKMGMPEQTPQSQLLSHENPSALKSNKVMKTANKKSYKTPSLATKHGNEPSFSRGIRLRLGVAKNDFGNSKSPIGSSDPAEVMLVGQAIEIPAVKPPTSPEPHMISRNYRQTALHYKVSKDHQTPSRAKSPLSSAKKQPPSLAGYTTKIPTIKSPKSPEQQCFSGNDVHTALGTEASRDCQAPITVKSVRGKCWPSRLVSRRE
ncbi:hypothetical protein Ancab_013066 [Ancistrocladus abbreviatus]